jgi:hypothetical protein
MPLYRPSSKWVVNRCMQAARQLLQSQTCAISACNNAFISCDNYAGRGCPSGSCTFTSCSQTISTGVLDCAWTCNNLNTGSISHTQPLVPCAPTNYNCKGSCTALQGSSCASGACVWDTCKMNLDDGATVCTPKCLLPPPVSKRAFRIVVRKLSLFSVSQMWPALRPLMVVKTCVWQLCSALPSTSLGNQSWRALLL